MHTQMGLTAGRMPETLMERRLQPDSWFSLRQTARVIGSQRLWRRHGPEGLQPAGRVDDDCHQQAETADEAKRARRTDLLYQGLCKKGR